MATFEKLENNRAKLTISVSPEAFGAAVQKAYQKTANRFNVPGFRKGKAPRKVIESMYGESAFYEEAFDLVWGDVIGDRYGFGPLSGFREHHTDESGPGGRLAHATSPPKMSVCPTVGARR